MDDQGVSGLDGLDGLDLSTGSLHFSLLLPPLQGLTTTTPPLTLLIPPPFLLHYTATKLGSGPSVNDASSIIVLGFLATHVAQFRPTSPVAAHGHGERPRPAETFPSSS